MDDPFDIGDLGVVDPSSLAFDVPEPNAADAATFESAREISASAVPLASIPDGGAYAPPSFSAAEIGGSDALLAPTAEEGVGMELGAIPEVVPQLPDPSGASYSSEGGGYESPAAFTIATPAPASDAPASAPGQSDFLGGLPGIALPGPSEAPFAGVSLPPEEAFDLSLVAPPAPAQEGFPGASDAPLSAPVGAWASALSEGGSIGHLRDLELRSTQIFGPLAGTDAAPAGDSRSSSLVIQNLHLPSANAGDMMSDLLAASTGTEADLSALEAT